MARKASFRVALLWSFVMNGGKRVILLVLTFVLAAILGPEDFGTVAMAAAYVLIAEMFLELGLTATLVQRKDLDDDHLNAAFWAVFGWSVVLMAVSGLLAPWWANANGLPELRQVIWALSVILPIEGLTVVQKATFQRDLDFRNLAIRANVAAFIAGGVSLAAAFAGWGVWALVLQRITIGLVGLLLLWWISPWRPHWGFEWRAARELVGFSSGAMLSRIAVFLTSRADALLMGLFFGPVAVGIYQLGHRLVGFIVDLAAKSIQPVAMADFSKLQDERERFNRAIARCLRTSASLAIPALAVLAIGARDVVGLLGEKWEVAAVPATLLCVVGMARACTIAAGPALRAVGRPFVEAAMMWGFAIPTVAAITTLGFLVRDSEPSEQAAAIAMARVVLFALVFFPVSIWVVRSVVRDAPLVRPLLPALASAGLGAGAIVALQLIGLIPTGPGFFPAALRIGATAALVYGLLLAFDPELRDRLKRLIDTARNGEGLASGPSVTSPAGDPPSDV